MVIFTEVYYRHCSISYVQMHHVLLHVIGITQYVPEVDLKWVTLQSLRRFFVFL